MGTLGQGLVQTLKFDTAEDDLSISLFDCCNDGVHIATTGKRNHSSVVTVWGSHVNEVAAVHWVKYPDWLLVPRPTIPAPHDGFQGARAPCVAFIRSVDIAIP